MLTDRTAPAAFLDRCSKPAAQHAIDMHRVVRRGDAVFRNNDNGGAITSGIGDDLPAQRVDIGQRRKHGGMPGTRRCRS